MARTSCVEILVRRGARRRFAALEQKTADLPLLVSWDRRKAERRTSSRDVPERRRRDRRQEPPFTWALADFIVVVRQHER